MYFRYLFERLNVIVLRYEELKDTLPTGNEIN